MTTDEDRLAQLLREQAEARIGDQRLDQSFRPSYSEGPERARKRTWLMPLLTAACVCTLVGGAAGTVGLLSDRQSPTQQLPGPVTSPPVRSLTRTAAPTHPPVAPSRTPTPIAPSRTPTTIAPSPTPIAPSHTPVSPPRTSRPAPRTRHAGTSGSTRSEPAVPTERVVQRPVTRSGKVAPGFLIFNPGGGVTDAAPCGMASRSAVDAGIDACSPASSGLGACWKETAYAALCMQQANRPKLIRVRVPSSQFRRLPPPTHPVPQVLVLADGANCTLRLNGTNIPPADHPRWNAFYYCDHSLGIYGPLNGDGIDTTHTSWTVRVYHVYNSGSPRPGGTQAVRTAYFVGTAR